MAGAGYFVVALAFFSKKSNIYSENRKRPTKYINCWARRITMKENVELFLFLSNTAWTAISSMATLAAVIVALFYPSYQEWRKIKNLIKIIKLEMKKNILLACRAAKEKDVQSPIQITRENIIAELMKTIDMEIWNNKKFYVAEYSSKEYLHLNRINEKLASLHMHALKICEMKGQTPEYAFIAQEVESIISEYEKVYGVMGKSSMEMN